MNYNHRYRQVMSIAIRLIFLCITALGVVWVLYSSNKYSVALILFGAVILQFWSLLNKLTISEREVINFLEAVRFSDFSQKLGRKGLGGTRSELAQAYDNVMGKFKKDRTNNELQSRYFYALIDHIPVALLSIKENQEASLLNNAAKRLFGLSHIHRISELKSFGTALIYELEHLRAGKKRLIRINHGNQKFKISLAATKIVIDGTSSYLVSLHNIQSELDTTQIEAWQDLVHVLTHELMNSLTPVASLSNSMNILMQDISDKIEQENISPELAEMLNDLQDGLGAISRRSGRLNSFVENYRKMTKVPPPKYQRLKVADIFVALEHLFLEPCSAKQITLTTDISPHSLALNADPELIDQAMINLIKNAIEAIKDQEGAIITLKSYLNRNGNTVIEIGDNGPGIDEEMLQRIFVPFYTTKQEGSGIGLSLTRQIMLAHQGSINCNNNTEGGISFCLIFKN